MRAGPGAVAMRSLHSRSRWTLPSAGSTAAAETAASAAESTAASAETAPSEGRTPDPHSAASVPAMAAAAGEEEQARPQKEQKGEKSQGVAFLGARMARPLVFPPHRFSYGRYSGCNASVKIPLAKMRRYLLVDDPSRQ